MLLNFETLEFVKLKSSRAPWR